MTPEEKAICDSMRLNGYIDARVLPDGSIAGVQRLMFTTGLFLGCTAWGYGRRFCFKSDALAMRRFAELQSEDDTPEGWHARRPELPEDMAAKSRSGYVGGDPALPTSWNEEVA